MMHGKLPANIITAGLDTFSEVRRGNKREEGGSETTDGELESL